MKSISYRQFVRMKTSDKSGNLLELSKLKRENPDEFNAYNAEFDMAYDRILRANNLHCAKLDGGKLFTEKTILENSNNKYPDMTFEELRKK
ncbi:hypothetical protein [Butyrivibrio sp. XPD2006]|uniref:hypothetical protein n=1 Tax=Butyrivibrio sp. XPD2006 TaxID=1280668 RepID=UPI0003B74511|nr:hypothetical protein [Butyrivibrio sp. XPD2006]